MSDPGNVGMGPADQPLHRGQESVPRAAPQAYTGSIIVRLRPEISSDKARTLEQLARELSLGDLDQLLKRVGNVPTRRVIVSVAPDELKRIEEAALHSMLVQWRSLTGYWRIDARTSPNRIGDILDALKKLPEVDIVYLELAASNPTNGAGTSLNTRQKYLDAAPVGIDARWAWTKTNGKGAGVAFVDLEQAWIPTHQDLAPKAPTLIFQTNRRDMSEDGTHGTGVLGEIVAAGNPMGVIGIANAVTSVRMVSHYDGATNTDSHIADAILAAVKVMDPGDVLLLEVQRGGAQLPTELDDCDFQAILTAVGKKIIVIEAAGNGGQNLDAWSNGGITRLNRASPGFRDSGAIMVGAGNSVLNAANLHDRSPISNFGSRIDCYAWADSIVTCGGGDIPHFTSDDDKYTAAFNGTSGAAAIIAGAALVLQSMHEGATGTRLSPAEMRTLLSNPATGTAQGQGLFGNIGVMPNLRAIAQSLGLG